MNDQEPLLEDIALARQLGLICDQGVFRRATLLAIASHRLAAEKKGFLRLRQRLIRAGVPIPPGLMDFDLKRGRK